MPRLIWSPEALRDLKRLHRFLAPNNPIAAKRAVSAIRRSVRALSSNPEIGRPAEDMPPNIRERIVRFGSGGYVALYRYDGKTIMIVAVRHGRESGYWFE